MGTKPNNNHLYTKRDKGSKPDSTTNHLHTRGITISLKHNHLYTRG